MDNSSLPSPRRAFRAASEGRSSPRRNTREDGETFTTRKRPRLGSKHRTYRSLSAEASSTPSALTALRPLEAHITTKETGLDTTMTEDQPANGTNPRNKVTLNIRDAHTTETQAPPMPSPTVNPSDLTSGHLEVLPSSPSSLGSPEIEVAEPEDAIGSIDPTIWKRAGEKSLEEQRLAIMDNFLVSQETDDYRHALGRIGMSFQWDGGDVGGLFTQLADLFENWTALADEFPKKIWELWTPDADFWNSMPTLIDGHIRKRTTIATVLRPVNSESFSNEIDLTGDDAESSAIVDSNEKYDRDPVLRFFKMFAAVLCRLLLMDEQTLLETMEDSAEPELAAKSFLQIFNWYTSNSASVEHLWRTYSGGRWSVSNIIDCMVLEFLTSSGDQNLLRCTSLLLSRSQTDLEYAACALATAANILLWTSMIDNVKSLVVQRACGLVSTLYTLCQQKFDQLIKKQTPGFSIEVARSYMVGLAECLKSLALLDYQQALLLLPPGYDSELEPYLVNHVSDSGMAAELLSLKLRLETALVCLKNGRMESRIAGVEAYSDMLLKIYKTYFSSRPEYDDKVHPTVAYCRGFIKDRDLIGYLVGVDSHPQVVARSKNIIGFQVATLCYGQKDTDTIWTAMRESKDPRRSEAIMEVLLAQVDYAGVAFLESFVEKLRGLPTEAFDDKMRHFVRDLLRSAAKNQPNGKVAESVALQVLIPMLQDCLGHPDISLKQKRAIWQFAYTELEGSMSELSETAKSEMCRTAVDSIQEAQSASTAGVALLSILLDSQYHGYDQDGHPFCATESFAQLLVEDLARCKQILKVTGFEEDNIQEILRPRLVLIEKALGAIQGWPFDNWMASLWQNLVGEQAVCAEARNEAFQMLAIVARQSSMRSRNDFLDICIREFFEQLNSNFMTITILLFAKEATEYYERFLRNQSPNENEDHPLPGDMFWHITLKASSPKLAEEAAKHFVAISLATPYDMSYAEQEKNHVRLVDRCVTCLTLAATTIKDCVRENDTPDTESMVPSTEEIELQFARLQFSRSLLVLKAFLEKIREKRLGSPVVRNESPLSDHSIRGQEIVFTFYKGSEKVLTSLSIGSESSLRDLATRLSKIFKSSGIRIFAGGQLVDQAIRSDEMLGDIPIFKSTKHLLVQKVAGGPPLPASQANRSMLPLEQQVMVHFDKLYELLDLNDEVGNEICDFLMTFPPKQEVLSASVADLLPLASLHKSIYCCDVLRKRLLSSISEGVLYEDDSRRIVQGVGHALIQIASTTGHSIAPPVDRLLQHMTECLSIALKESPPQEVPSDLLPDPVSFINSTIVILATCLKDHNGQDRTAIVLNCFAIVLEASLKNAEAWAVLKAHEAINDILKAIWLSSSSEGLRTMTAKIVKGICAALPVLQSIDASDFLNYFWSQTLAIVPATPDYAAQAKQFFDVGMTIFRATTEHDGSFMLLDSYVSSWGAILLNHVPQGSWSGSDKDYIVDGLTDMLIWALQIIKSRKQPFEGSQELLHKVFTTHVFPSLPPWDDKEPANIRVPVLASSTRAKLYTLIMTLVSDQITFQTLGKLVQNITPYPTDKGGSWSHGIAQILDNTTDSAWAIERDKIVRADTGYAGLRNLSNTCYFNSLLEQLFMNVGFRNFLLQMQLEDPDKHQLLLFETQRLFAYMQGTWLKSVDPSNVIDKIITFDGEAINVHVQMDVDEFYNLLFDRLENQITSEQEKTAFRRFYGGQLVQQIKSQDCPHVSERLEPFSVIQCEIQGKAGLVESLNAFIEGEMMQGDNKYKCTSCDGYVNAVKRACLKEVPDNLIFHLKRFDFDLVSGVRHKINDQFEFPMELDMAPYHIDHLRDPRNTPVPDKFMLVGILVHSGTAEIGHYYSFVRERPGIKYQWVEMNDSEITRYDASNIAQSCFGGWDHATNPAWMKPYNAYMLFYQRVESMENDAQMYPSAPGQPVNVQVPIVMSNQITMENESWIRRFCLLDPAYLKFCRDILEKHRSLFQEQCSDEHKLEDRLIRGVVGQIELVFARVKDAKQIDELLKSLERMLKRCIHCTTEFIKAVTSENAFRTLLFRCPHDIIKVRLADAIFQGLEMIKDKEPQLYDGGVTFVESPGSQDDGAFPFSAFHEVMGACDRILMTIPALTRGWDDFWNFLCRLAMRGKWEIAQVHDREYFTKLLQILCYNGDVPTVQEWHFANAYLKNRVRKRYVMGSFAELLVVLLRGYLQNVNDLEAGALVERINLSQLESRMLQHSVADVQSKNRSHMNAVLLGFLNLRDIDISLYRDFMQCLMEYSNGEDMSLKSYQSALARGACIPAREASPFLAATLAFAESCPHDKLIQQLVNRFADGVMSIGDEGGAEHLDFFSRLRFVHNAYLANYGPAVFKRIVTRRLFQFAPFLAMYHEDRVRRGTILLVNSLLFDVDPEKMEDEEFADELGRSGRELTIACLDRLTAFIKSRKLIDIRRFDELIDITRNGFFKFFAEDNEEDKSLMDKFQRCLDAVPEIAAASPDGIESVEYSDSEELTDNSITQP